MPSYEVNQYRGAYKRALELYNDEKYKDAAPMLEMVVAHDQSNFNACYYLGDCLYYGKGVAKNVKRAFELFMTAATNKITDAEYMVGVCYLEGSGTRQDSTQAVAWFTEAAKYAHPLSQYYLGLAYMKGEGITKDIPRATQWLVHAAKSGVVDAQRDAGDCYEMLGNMKGAATLFLAGAENGDSYCQERIADCYADGTGTLQCTELAIHYYEEAAGHGNVNAQVKMAKRYMNGNGVAKSMKKSIFWLMKASNADNAEAQNLLGECYHLGDGINKSDDLAVGWWTKSANSGNVEAMIHLAEILTDDEDMQDLTNAKYWWTKAAEAGDPYAMYRLGDCYEHAIGVAVVNVEDAFKWYRLASQGGNEDATEACKRFSRGMNGKVKLKKI